MVLEAACLNSDDVDAISLSANGNYGMDRSEALGCQQVFNGKLSTIPVTSTKSMLGEGLGASGAIQAIDAIESLADGCLPGIPGSVHLSADSQFGAVASEIRHIDAMNLLVSSVGLDGPVVPWS